GSQLDPHDHPPGGIRDVLLAVIKNHSPSRSQAFRTVLTKILKPALLKAMRVFLCPKRSEECLAEQKILSPVLSPVSTITPDDSGLTGKTGDKSCR
ncbi:hypothetical protein, partial [Chromobacterium subtsugae]|uniref:hypothetical protein n=1 Tax=Chromobacterium subtsugae TaxID=251747 RepID=UPI001C0FE3C1